MTRRPVPRSLRIANAAALLVFLAGAGVYGRAWLGMRALKSYEADADAALFAGLERFNHFWELSRLGIGLVLAALLLALLTAVAAVMMGRRQA